MIFSKDWISYGKSLKFEVGLQDSRKVMEMVKLWENAENWENCENAENCKSGVAPFGDRSVYNFIVSVIVNI